MSSDSSDGQPLVIVVGRGHSGTRAISRTLSESGIFMGAELNGSYDLVPASDMYEACRVIAKHVKHSGGVSWDFSDVLSAPIDPEFERLVRSYAASVLEHDEGFRGWKLPETTLALPWIVRMFEDAYYISWVRDPRDSIIGEHLTDDLADFGVPYSRVEDVREMRAVSWKYQRAIVGATPKPRRWTEVRFEDFVLDQEQTLRRLESFLGVPLARIDVRTDSVGRYLTDDGEYDFEFLADDIAELGYEPTPPRVRVVAEPHADESAQGGRKDMEIGVVTRSFPQLTNEETAEFLAANGFSSVELCFKNADSDYWIYNGRGDLSEMTDDRSQTIVETYRSAGLDVPVLGVFTNVLEPDDDERAANLEHFERMMQIASFNGIPIVATECGFRPGSRGINADTYEADFDRLVQSFRWLCDRADTYDVDVALEPCVLDVVPSAKRARDFVLQVGSPRAKILLDPANLIANSSEADMFAYLAPHIAYLHGKDRKLNDAKGRIVGDGDIDWPTFLSLYHIHTEGKPFILEYVNQENVREVRDRVLDAEQKGSIE